MSARAAMSMLILLLLAACGLPGNVVVLIPDENGAVGSAVVSHDSGAVTLAGPYAGARIDPGAAPDPIKATTKARVDRDFAATLAATPPTPQVFRVYFANASAELDQTARSVLDTAIAAARATPAVEIGIAGHTDAIGNMFSENLPLSQRRAEAVRQSLIAAGLPAVAIEISFFGAEDPVVPNRLGVPEPLNRRVEVTVR